MTYAHAVLHVANLTECEVTDLAPVVTAHDMTTFNDVVQQATVHARVASVNVNDVHASAVSIVHVTEMALCAMCGVLVMMLVGICLC